MSRDPKLSVPEFGTTCGHPNHGAPDHDCTPFVADPCNECNRDVPEADAGPSCGAHVLHVECGPWFGCRECYLIRSEIP